MTLKDFAHDSGLNMAEFHKLDKETQAKWRTRQAERNRIEQMEKVQVMKEIEDFCKKFES